LSEIFKEYILVETETGVDNASQIININTKKKRELLNKFMEENK